MDLDIVDPITLYRLPFPNLKPSKVGTDSCNKLPTAERLDNIVIGTDFQTYNTVDFFRAATDHENYGVQASFPDLTADIKSRHIRKTDIQKDDMGILTDRLRDRIHTVFGRYYLVALLLQPGLDSDPIRSVIVNDQKLLQK
jgi:hypothetical protein